MSRFVVSEYAAQLLDLKQGHTHIGEDADNIRHAYRKASKAADNARFQAALEDAKSYERIVVKNWSRNGQTLRRGTIIKVRKLVLGDYAVKHRQPGKKLSSYGIWSAGGREIDEFTISARELGEVDFIEQ